MDPVRREQTDQRDSAVQLPLAPKSASEADLSVLPDSRAMTTLVAVPVDPYVVHCEWEVAPADIERAKQALGVGEHEYWPVLQFYDLTNTARDEAAGSPSFSVEVQLAAENWYVRSCSPEHTYRAELALKAEVGSVAVVARSNTIETPPTAPSSYADENWLPIRLTPQQPESATPMPSPVIPAAQPPSAIHSEPAGSAVRLPVDMREEVRTKLSALYGEWHSEAFETPAQVQSQLLGDTAEEARGEAANLHDKRETEESGTPPPASLPIDMQMAVRNVLSRLYQLDQEPPVVAGPLRMPGSLLMQGFRGEHFSYAFEAVLREMKKNNAVDLAELNERSFTSGVSSRTK